MCRPSASGVTSQVEEHCVMLTAAPNRRRMGRGAKGERVWLHSDNCRGCVPLGKAAGV